MQRKCASVFKRMMPTPSSNEAEGSVPRGARGKGRGKGGPRRRSRATLPEDEEEEEEQEEQPQEEEEEEQQPQEDDGVPSAESSDAEEEEEEEDDTTGGTPAVWLRGPSRLPDRPIPLGGRPLIEPSGPA